MKIDVFYPLIEAPGDNIELRYSLRSLENIVGGYGDVYIVGHKPRWVKDVVHIPFRDKRKTGMWTQLNMQAKEYIVCQTSKAEDILSMNDDIYILSPMRMGFYVCDEGHIKNVIASAIKRKRPSYVIEALRNTQAKFPDGHSAYIHKPHRQSRELVLELHEKYDLTNTHYLLSDLYCNEYRDTHPWQPTKDIKIYNNPLKIRDFLDCGIISTGDAAAKNKHFRRVMDKIFPNKSRHERA